MSDGLNPNKELCARCGQVAKGSAFIGDKRYCHGDTGPDCYTEQSHEGTSSYLEQLGREAIATGDRMLQEFADLVRPLLKKIGAGDV